MTEPSTTQPTSPNVSLPTQTTDIAPKEPGQELRNVTITHNNTTEQNGEKLPTEVDLESQTFEDEDTYATDQPLISRNSTDGLQPPVRRESEEYFDQSILTLCYRRGIWLVLLLFLQSFSSFILATFEALLQKHIIISLFLTMLIGTGGNSGSQTTIEIVRRIATGEIKKSNVLKVMWKEMRIGLILSVVVGVVAFMRVYFYRLTNFPESEQNGHFTFIAIFTSGVVLRELIALTISIVLVVIISVVVCAAIPLFLHFGVGIDAAIASGPLSSVLMDLIGVSITVGVCSLIL